MSDEVLEGALQPPQPTGDAAVLAAFREVTGWDDEDVLHWATCQECDPLGGDFEYYCRNSPQRRREREEAERQEAARPPGESSMDHAVAVLRDAIRRTAEDAARQAREQAPLSTGAVRSTATEEALALLRAQTRSQERPRPFGPRNER